MKKDYQTHVFTTTYTADVSGACSALYELGGMSILHDPSGCNSTYSTHDEPRWFDTKSLMYVSGIDEITAVMGDDQVLINDAKQAAEDVKPRFIMLCGASIPHIIAFDFKGVARLMERETGIPVLPVPTDGLKSYVSGADLAFSAFLERFGNPEDRKRAEKNAVNILGATPLDFSVNGNVELLRKTLEENGFSVNTCMAMGDTFEQVSGAYKACANVVVSSCARQTARLMKRRAGIPYVEGLPVGREQTRALAEALRKSLEDGEDRTAFTPFPETGRFEAPEGAILVIGEEVFAKSLASAVNRLPMERRGGLSAFPCFPDPDMGLPEDDLIRAAAVSSAVIGDPLFAGVSKKSREKKFLPFPHEAASGRIFRRDIPVFAGPSFDVEGLIAPLVNR